MKKLQFILCTTLILVFLLPKNALACQSCQEVIEATQPGLVAEAVILIDVASGKVLYEKNADLPMYPASTTKIMTALLLLEHAELSEIITVGEEIRRIGPGSSTAKLKIGDELTVAELVYALMLPSGNDASYTAAVFVARKGSGFAEMDIDDALVVFAEMMNQRAQELGAENTNFTVPDGYHTPQHYSSARDLALITLEAIKNEFITEVARSPEYFWQGGYWTNTNRMLQQDAPGAYYPWATGFKTGYTREAGHCFVATATANGREVVGVVLNSTREDRWLDSRALLEYGFSAWRNYEMLVEGRQVLMVPVTNRRNGEPEVVEILAGGGFADLLHVQHIAQLELQFDWAKEVLDQRKGGIVLKAPIRRGQVLGQGLVILNNHVLAEVDLIAAHRVYGSLWWLPTAVVAVLLFIMTIIIISMFRRRRRSRVTVDK